MKKANNKRVFFFFEASPVLLFSYFFVPMHLLPFLKRERERESESLTLTATLFIYLFLLVSSLVSLFYLLCRKPFFFLTVSGPKGNEVRLDELHVCASEELGRRKIEEKNGSVAHFC